MADKLSCSRFRSIESIYLKEILKSDKSCISNPKSEILNWTPSGHCKLLLVAAKTRAAQTVQSEISDFGFEMQDLSDFKLSARCSTAIASGLPRTSLPET